MNLPQRDDLRGSIWDLSLIPDLQGKVALVTGANAETSIGWHTAHELAKKGAKVFIHARSQEKAQAGIDAIIKTSPSIPKENLGAFIAEFSDLKGIKKAAEKFVQVQGRLDILVNNAGLLARKLDLDANGISISMLTNHLAPFVLTTTLLPLLKKTAASGADVRVVTLSSTTQTLIPHAVRFRNVDDFNISFGHEDGMPANVQRYGLSKLANLLFARELQRRLDQEKADIISVSLHPGGVVTPGSVNFVTEQLGKTQEALSSSLTPLQGAITSLFAATAPEVRSEKEKYGGRYLMPFGVPSPEDESENAKNLELATELWATSEKLVAQVLSKYITFLLL